MTLVLFQMTVSKQHPVFFQGLNDVISKLKGAKGDRREFRTLLVFLTPPSVFKEWKVAQRVKTSGGEDAKTIVCDQEVWCLDKRDHTSMW
jgi:hypothetical protein